MREGKGQRWNATGARSVWGWGLAADEPTDEQRRKVAGSLARRYGIEPRVESAVPIADVELRAPRIAVPPTLAAVCTTDRAERARHTYGMAYTDRLRAFRGRFDEPPDVVAYPADDRELETVLDWCDGAGHVVIPFGGGSSVVWGVNPPAGAASVVTVDLRRLDRVLDIDDTSRAARIQAGALGPAVEDQLRPPRPDAAPLPAVASSGRRSAAGSPHARAATTPPTTPTSTTSSSQSRMLTPAGWWESRRLPGSGAGPSPDRLVLGSEGTLGIITEAWMRIQRRPVFRATAGVRFPSWEAGWRRGPARSSRPSYGRPTCASSTRSRPSGVRVSTAAPLS